MTDPRITEARPADVPTLVELVRELAVHTEHPEDFHLTESQLDAALFGSPPAASALTGRIDPAGAPDGFALWYPTFSTWDGVPGIHLEDLYVRPTHRGSGLGKALLTGLAQIAVARGWTRVEWTVLNWNTPSIDFYRAMGAEPLSDWTMFRLSGPALHRRATESS